MRDVVILVHGLGRSSFSFVILDYACRLKGYRTLNVDYPSRLLPFDALVDVLQSKVAEEFLDTSSTVHFVTHSLGGLLVRRLLQLARPRSLGRVVMLCPPNQGSEVSDYLSRTWLGGLILGPTGKELRTSSTSLPNTLGPVGFPLGVITGNKSLNPILSSMIPGPNDGKVAVARAMIEGMTDFLVVPHSHTFIMNSPSVITQVFHFLKRGKFKKPRAVRLEDRE